MMCIQNMFTRIVWVSVCFFVFNFSNDIVNRYINLTSESCSNLNVWFGDKQTNNIHLSMFDLNMVKY